MFESEQSRAILTVCGAFLLDTDPSKADDQTLSDRCAALFGIQAADLRPLAEVVLRELRTTGAWSAFLESVQQLRATCSDDRLREVIDVLMTISLEDNQYEHSENRMIFALGREWDIHLDDSDGQEQWSVLTDSRTPAGSSWTAVHDLAVLYVALAHRTDRILSADEVEAIRQKLSEWLPESLPGEVSLILEEAIEAYGAGSHDEMLESAFRSVTESVPKHQRKAVLNDLMFVARADNVVLVEERELIARIAAAWAIDVSGID